MKILLFETVRNVKKVQEMMKIFLGVSSQLIQTIFMINFFLPFFSAQFRNNLSLVSLLSDDRQSMLNRCCDFMSTEIR